MGEKESISRKGLTWRVWLVILFSALIVQPALVYFYLVTGMGLPISNWLVVLAIIAVSSVAGQRLRIQESFLILWTGTQFGIWGWYFVNFIRNMYFATNPITKEFGISQYIPSWWAPPYEISNRLLRERTFFDPALLLPIGISLTSTTLMILSDICLGIVGYSIYVRAEKLDFPSYSAAAETLIEITEKGESYRIVLISILAGIIYNIASFWPAFITGNPVLQVIPRGLIDLTSLIETSFPGATFGITTDVYPILTGFLMPIPVTAAMFTGAFSMYFVGNHIATKMNLWPPEFSWKPGLGMSQLTLHSQLYFWFSLSMGLAFAALLLPLASRPKFIINAFKSMRKAGEMKGSYNVYLAFGLFLAAALTATVMTYILVPGFPWWITLFFTVGWSIFSSLISAYSVGVTFGGFGVPYLKESTIYFSGYRNMDIWFAPIMISTGGPFFAGSFKQADMCQVDRSEVIRTYIIVTVLGITMSLVCVQMLWSASPIPGPAYAYTVTGWPSETMAWARWFRWLWTGHLFHPDLIIGGFIAGSIIYLITSYLFHAPHILISLLAGIFLPPPFITGSIAAGLVGGAMTLGQIGALTGQVSVPTFTFAYGPIPTTIAALLGSIIGQLVMKRRFGPNKWKKMAPLVVMGFGIGDSSMWVFAWAMVMIGKALWILPY